MPTSNPIRSQAVRDSIGHKPKKMKIPMDDLGRVLPVTEYFGTNSLSAVDIAKKLEQEDADKLLDLIAQGKGLLDKDFADKVAKIVKSWAIEKGITHFCHWFQPMTGATAEKHDAFLSFDSKGEPVEMFTGSQLAQSEPDASSFPSGGMRATFEARGYTAWDLSSPIFIVDGTNGKTLCIPSVFISYHGNAQDEKLPLLRSVRAINEAATKSLNLLGETGVKRVKVTLGAEQEYFLIDKSYFSIRPDLVMTGRTLVGARPPKGQELEDHYFGAIPQRVTAFMQEVEFELYKLGIPAKTRHNEVAPAQFEIAAIFEDVNVAVDHNQMIMEVLKSVAARHNFKALLHEKPFAGVNGSGKHNNWAMATDAGENLLEPGATPHQNLRFLYFLGAVLKGVYRHNGLMRASIASPGNDHRLGANEAPPAIVSAFLGAELTEILDKIKSGEKIENAEKAMIDFGISQIAQIRQDKTDRNRTSPFAFTGNKFEYRAVGSSASCAWPMTCLNAAVAEALNEMNAKLEKAFSESNDKEQVLLELIRETIIESDPVRFEGDNYSDEWLAEAEKRGLDHLKGTPQALVAYHYENTTKLFKELRILNEEEMESRFNVFYERYIKKIEIETEAMFMLLDVYVQPAASSYIGDLANQAAATKAITGSATAQEDRVKKLQGLLDDLHKKRLDLESAFKSASKGDEKAQVKAFGQKVLPAIEAARESSDKLECIIGDAYWPLPKYREMLFMS